MSPVADYDPIPLYCFQLFGRDAQAIGGQPPEWKRIAVRCSTSKLTFHAMEADEPGGRFQQLITGTQRHLAGIETDARTSRDRLVQWLGKVQYAIGVVAEPAFVTEDHHCTCIMRTAEKLRGLVLFQSGFFNPAGAVVLDVEGNADAGALESVAS